jgi:diguanylate cyclase
MSHISGLLQNIANIIVFILLSNRLYAYLNRLNKPAQRLLIGVLFGLAGLISMQMPIAAGEGITVDLKAVLTGMAGFLGGPVSAAVALIAIGSYRLYMGGIGMVPGLVCMGIVALAGSWIHLRVSRQSPFGSQRWWAPLLFGCFIALVQLATAFLFPPAVRDELLRQYTLPLLVIYPIAAGAFYYFIAVDWKGQNEANFDPITQLPRYERFHRKWTRRLKGGRPFAIVILSLDRLEAVVDLHGKPASNGLLREFGKRLVKGLPYGGYAAHLDGYRYVLSLPNAITNQALQSLHEIKLKLLEPYEIDESLVHLTFSSGLAVDSGGNSTMEILIYQAETALRQAMTGGWNQIVSYENRLNKTGIARSWRRICVWR